MLVRAESKLSPPFQTWNRMSGPAEVGCGQPVAASASRMQSIWYWASAVVSCVLHGCFCSLRRSSELGSSGSARTRCTLIPASRWHGVMAATGRWVGRSPGWHYPTCTHVRCNDLQRGATQSHPACLGITYSATSISTVGFQQTIVQARQRSQQESPQVS